MNKKLFINRAEALEKLCNILPLAEMSQDSWIIIASSSGAVPLAFGLAKELNAQFDFMFTQKIMSVVNDECEVAIVTETKDIIIQEELMKSFNIKLEDIYKKANEKYDNEIKEYIKYYRNGKPIIDMAGKNVLLVDEGLNTGSTMMACIKSAISCKASSIAVAVAVLPEVTIADIESIADDLYFVSAPAHFVSIDFYYEELENLDLELIKNIINNDKKFIND